MAKCVAERWIQYFGPPMSIISDQGKEFVGTQFIEFTNANSVLLHIIDVRAPRQNGRTERHGDIHKRMFERARWMHSPSSPVALQHLAMECNVAKNRLSNCSGNPPLQRVFGTGHRLPADLTSDDVFAPHLSMTLQRRMQVLRSRVRFAPCFLTHGAAPHATDEIIGVTMWHA